MIVGGREAAKVADRLKAYKVPVILRLTVPEEPAVPTEPEYRKKAVAERDDPLRVLAHRKAKWKEQLATASVLAKEGIPFAFATDGVDRLDTVPANLRHIIGAGLKPDDALAALTTQAAAIAGVESASGPSSPASSATSIVMTAPFTEERAKVRFVLLDGLKFEIKPEDAARAKGKGAGGRGGRPGGAAEAVEKSSQEDQPDETAPDTKKETPAQPDQAKPGRPANPGQDDERQAMLRKIDNLQKENDQSQTQIADLKARIVQLHKEEGKTKADVKPQSDQPKTSSPESQKARPSTPKSEEMKKAVAKAEEPKKAVAKAEEAKKAAPKAEAPKPAAPPFVDVASELDEDRKPTLHTGGSVLIKDATILTVTKGTIPKGSILIEKGKIKAVGKDVTAPQA